WSNWEIRNAGFCRPLQVVKEPSEAVDIRVFLRQGSEAGRANEQHPIHALLRVLVPAAAFLGASMHDGTSMVVECTKRLRQHRSIASSTRQEKRATVADALTQGFVLVKAK